MKAPDPRPDYSEALLQARQLLRLAEDAALQCNFVNARQLALEAIVGCADMATSFSHLMALYPRITA